MSIKGSSKALKTEYLFPIFIIATIMAAAVRTYQYFSIIEPGTGFYSQKDFSVALLYITLALAGILIFGIGYLAKKVPQATLPEGKNIPLAVASIIAALTFFADSIKLVMSGLSRNVDSYTETPIITNGMISYLIKSGTATRGLEALFAILSAVYFIIFATKYFGASVNVRGRKILAVMPVFWATMRMVTRFTRTISFIFVSDLLLELFMIAFMMMFFLSFAQLASDVNSRHVMNKVYAYGLIGAMLAFVVAVPRIIFMIAKQTAVMQPNPLEICDLGFAFFAIAICAALIKLPKDDNLTLKAVEKLKKEREEEEENEEKIKEE